MSRSGAATRARIMNEAERLILSYGFAGTSLERILEAAGVTKGAFFHHFDGKADLARALVERYARLDAEHLEGNLTRAEALARDPLQQVLVFVGLLREQMRELAAPYPGCLFASYCYEAQLFDERTMSVAADAMLLWRRRFGAKLEAVIAAHPPRLPVAASGLADALVALSEGAIVVSRTVKEPALVAEQLEHYRNYLELLFAAPPADAAG